MRLAIFEIADGHPMLNLCWTEDGRSLCIFLLFASYFVDVKPWTVWWTSRVKGYSVVLTLLLLNRKATSASCFPCANFIASILHKTAEVLLSAVFYLPTGFKHTGGPTFWWARKSGQRTKELLRSFLKIKPAPFIKYDQNDFSNWHTEKMVNQNSTIYRHN